MTRVKAKKYVIWGAGAEKNKKAFDALLPNFELVGFIDKFESGVCEGMTIFSTLEYAFDKSAYIVIATSVGGFDIMEFLKEKGVSIKSDFMVGNISE